MGFTKDTLIGQQLGNGSSALNAATPSILQGLIKNPAQAPMQTANGAVSVDSPIYALQDMMANFARGAKGFKPGVYTSNMGVTNRAPTASATAGAY